MNILVRSKQQEMTGIRIQLKELPHGKSKSLTIYGTNLNTEFNRLFFLYDGLEKNNGEMMVVHYDKKTIEQ